MKKLKQLLNMLTTVIATMILVSCGGNIKKEFNLSTEGVKGGMKDYIEVAPGSYKLIVDDKTHDMKLTIKLRSIEKTDIDFQEVYNLIMSPLEIQILDDKGNPPAMGGRMQYMEGSDKLKKLLKDGEENFFSFQTSYKDDDMKDINLAKFILNTNATEYTETSSETASDNSDKSVSSSGSEDWDKILSDYSTFIDKYISLLKKAKDGDASAMGEYADVMQQAQDLGDKLQNAQDDLTPTQASKFIKLQTKLADAALKMAGQ